MLRKNSASAFGERFTTNLFKLCAAVAVFAIFTTININAAPGDLDTTFGAGKVFTAMSSTTDYVNAVAVQPDGKIVAAGALYNTNGSQYDTAISRYNSDGTLDSSFAGDGTTFYSVSGTNNDYANAVAIDSNGKIVITGQYISGSGNWNTFVMRFNSDGTTDTTFGAGGLVTTDISGGARNNLARAIALQTDGKIVVAGYTNTPSAGNNFVVVRYTASGAIDFNRAYDVSLIGGVDEANSVAVQADGKIIAGGYAFTGASGSSSYDFALLRLNADGTVDSSYNGGVVHTNFNSHNDYIYSAALQTDGKLVVGGSAGDGTRGNFALARYNINGTLDTSFDGDGKLSTNLNSRPSEALAVKIQTDGKIVAAGYNSNGINNDFALARYNADGSLDATFNGTGIKISSLTTFNNSAHSVAIQPDGKIIAAGRGNYGATGDDFAVARFNTNGSFDATFAPSGKVTTAIGSSEDIGHAVALQSDGKIVVSGRYYGNSSIGWYCALVRYNADGTLDTSFGTGGKATSNYANNNFEENYKDVTIQVDGKIVVTGYYYDGAGFNFITARYNSNGTLDTTFNGGGFVARDFGSTSGDYAYTVAVQTDGKIVVAGESGNGSLRNSAFVRYNTNGTLDTSFGSGGSLIVAVSSADADGINRIELQPDGKIVGVGYAYPVNGGIGHFSAVRLTNSGALDSSFNGSGIVTTQIGSGTSIANSVSLQADGKVVAAGYTQNGTNYNLALTRYNTDGSLDTSFDADGKITTTVSGVNSYGYAVKIQSDGKIVVAGQTAGAGNANDFLLARYNPNGSLDTNFSGDGLVVTDLAGFSDAAVAITIQPDGKIIAAGQGGNGSNNDFALVRYLPGADCSYSISPLNANVSAATSNGSIAVTANESYCAWNAVSNAAWITVTGGAGGVGNGTVNYSVAANAGAARVGTITVAGQTFTVNQAAAIDVSMPTGINALRNTVVTVPVGVSDTTGKGIISFDFMVAYDASVLTPVAVPYDNAGTLSSSFTITSNAGTSGQLRISGYHTAAMAGAGAMLNLKFTASGNPQTCSALAFSAFQFNDGNPAANTSNGQICIVNGSVSGTVRNGNTTDNSAVPNVTLTGVGGSTLSTMTATDGSYLLEGFGVGNYTVTPSKSGDINGAIASLDASLIARYAVGLDPLSASQILAADVSSSNTINSYDAALISQYLVNINNPGNTGTWKFIPASRSYTDLTANQPNQDYTAILMGDVTGNWTAPNPFAEFTEAKIEFLADAITVRMPNAYGTQGQFVTVPVSVSDTTAKGILAYDFELAFDSNILQLDSVEPVNKTGTVSSQLNITTNPNVAARLLVSAFGVQPIQGSGTLLNVRFRVVGQAGQVSPLTFQRFLANENPALSVSENGQIRVVAPTSANVSLAGRVSTAKGSGIANVIVNLTDTNGITRTTRSNSFGYYRFDEVAVGGTYTVSVSAKRFSFEQPTHVVSVSEELTDVDFVANE